MQTIIIFESHVDNFSKRLWRTFSPYFLFYSLFLFLPLFNKHGNKAIIFIWWALVLVVIISIFIGSYKWTRRAVALISFTGDTFKIEVVDKNLKKTFEIHKENIRTVLKWTGGRPKILMLTIYNSDKKIVDLYSGGRQKNEYILEDIAHQIKAKISTNL